MPILRSLIYVLALVVISALGAFAQTRIEAQNFNQPQVRGYAVNWCKHQGRDCGQPAADLFCQEMGFERANGFTHDQRAGARGVASVIFGDGVLCQGPHCQAFGAINCIRTVAAPRQHRTPRQNARPPKLQPQLRRNRRSSSLKPHQRFRPTRSRARHCGLVPTATRPGPKITDQRASRFFPSI